MLRDVQIVSAQICVYGSGHWEGLIFDRAIMAQVGEGIDLTAIGSGGATSTYPWVHVVNSHSNAYWSLGAAASATY